MEDTRDTDPMPDTPYRECLMCGAPIADELLSEYCTIECALEAELDSPEDN